MAKTNVTYTKTNYKVNTEEKSVLCVLDFVIDLDKIKSISILNDVEDFDNVINTLVYRDGVKHILNDDDKYGKLQFRVYDFAFCSNDDVFDPVLGKRLALTRAQKCAFRTAKHFYLTIEDLLHKQFEQIYQLTDACLESEMKCHDHEFEITDTLN